MCSAPPFDTLDGTLDAFSEHLRITRGCLPATCERSVRDVRQLLTLLPTSDRLDLRQVTGDVLRRFVVDRATRYSSRTARRSASAARSFVRFLHLSGVVDGRLAQAVPSVRDTRRAALPKALAPAELRQLLEAVDPSTPVGQRDRAMLVCLASLGLRAKEVAELSLDAIDWRAGTLTIATSKTRRAHRLPLPATVGRAIATYLRSGRPATAVRRVFVRHLAPIGAPLRSANVSGAVRRAFLRCALDVPARGAHALRHTAATHMVGAGVSLKAVADVLGHRSLDTTALYTKVDLSRLREVARPWPEEVAS
jgi:site-specific recombinase XerD